MHIYVTIMYFVVKALSGAYVYISLVLKLVGLAPVSSSVCSVRLMS